MREVLDSLHIVSASDWTLKSGFPEDSLLTFHPIDRLPQLDTAGLNQVARDSVVNAWYRAAGWRIYGMRLSFDAGGRSTFTHRLECKVGATVYRMDPFVFDPVKMCVRMRISRWNEQAWEEDRCYEVVALSEKEMVWKWVQDK